MNKKIFVLFDNDGTLVDSEPLAMGVVADYAVAQAKEQGISVPRQDVLDLFGKTIQQILDITGEKHGAKFPATARNEVLATTIDALAKSVEEVPGCRHFLEVCAEWKKSGAIADMAVVTSSEFVRVKPGLRRNGLAEPFGEERMFSANDTLAAAYGKPMPKPDPAIYNHAKKVIGITPDDITITFEDSGSGVAAAKAAGITYIVAHLGAGHIPAAREEREAYAQSLRDKGATHVIQHWNEAAPLAASLIDTHTNASRPRQSAFAALEAKHCG